MPTKIQAIKFVAPSTSCCEGWFTQCSRRGAYKIVYAGVGSERGDLASSSAGATLADRLVRPLVVVLVAEAVEGRLLRGEALRRRPGRLGFSVRCSLGLSPISPVWAVTYVAGLYS